MTDLDTQCATFTNDIRSTLYSIKNDHANEVFELQKTIADMQYHLVDLQDRLTELKHPGNPLLTKERAIEIANEENIDDVRNPKSGWITLFNTGVGGKQKRMTICANRGLHNKLPFVEDLDSHIWMGTRVEDESIFTDINIPIGRFEAVSDGTSGKIYTTKNVYESTFRQVLEEMKK